MIFTLLVFYSPKKARMAENMLIFDYIAKSSGFIITGKPSRFNEISVNNP